MKRTSTHLLEDESRDALRSFLPLEWIKRNKVPDYAIDMEIEIVEGEDITNKVLWLQIKSTESMKSSNQTYSFPIETKYLKHYEKCRTPVIILLWIKAENSFYHIFAQRYIEEKLNVDKSNWREQKKVTLKFPVSSKLETPEMLEFIATEGYFYVTRQQLIEKTGGTASFYWLDGIPKSDDKELKERTLKALNFTLNEKITEAINEYEEILRVCTISPTEKMAILINLGDGYYLRGNLEEAYRNYNATVVLASKANKKDAIVPRSHALNGMGLVFWNQGNLDESFSHLQGSFDIIKDKGHITEEMIFLNNIGLLFRAKGKPDTALKYFSEVLQRSQENANKRIEAAALGNIGLIHMETGDLDKALLYHQNARSINQQLGNRREEALDLGNIGIIYRDKGDLDNALRTFKELLKIHREGGYKQSEASDLGNIGLICRDKRDFNGALRHSFQALKIYQEIGYKEEEAICLGNIGRLYFEKGNPDNALKYLAAGLNILDKHGLSRGKRGIQAAIDYITRKTN